MIIDKSFEVTRTGPGSEQLEIDMPGPKSTVTRVSIGIRVRSVIGNGERVMDTDPTREIRDRCLLGYAACEGVAYEDDHQLLRLKCPSNECPFIDSSL